MHSNTFCLRLGITLHGQIVAYVKKPLGKGMYFQFRKIQKEIHIFFTFRYLSNLLRMSLRLIQNKSQNTT